MTSCPKLWTVTKANANLRRFPPHPALQCGNHTHATVLARSKGLVKRKAIDLESWLYTIFVVSSLHSPSRLVHAQLSHHCFSLKLTLHACAITGTFPEQAPLQFGTLDNPLSTTISKIDPNVPPTTPLKLASPDIWRDLASPTQLHHHLRTPAMHVLHSPKYTHEPVHRRRLSRWAALHAWKLAGLTAVVTFVGVFIAVTLSLILRPTRSYFFPLLSDVYKHQPEGAILRVAMIASTILFFATTTASFLHCHSLQLFSRDRTTPLHEHSDTSLVDVTAEILPNTPVVKRRTSRFNSMQLLIAIPLAIILSATFLQYSGLGDVLLELLKRQSVRKLGKYILGLAWMCAMCFLVWYFLKLQQMPDRNSTELPLQDDSSLSENVLNDDAQNAETPQPLTRMRRWLSWLILMLRPVCLTGQAVCVIKIVGLWLALDTFSIANIRLVKITLLAALAFAEYTAAFFFAFFMSILAVDMRAKASHPDVLWQTG